MNEINEVHLIHPDVCMHACMYVCMLCMLCMYVCMLCYVCIVPYCIVLYCIALRCIVLYCIVLCVFNSISPASSQEHHRDSWRSHRVMKQHSLLTCFLSDRVQLRLWTFSLTVGFYEPQGEHSFGARDSIKDESVQSVEWHGVAVGMVGEHENEAGLHSHVSTRRL